MHHGAEADPTDAPQRQAIFLADLPVKVLVAVLQARPNVLQAVRPDAILESVFPFMTPRGERQMVLTDQHRLDAGRAELDAEKGPSSLNCKSSIHIYLPD